MEQVLYYPIFKSLVIAKGLQWQYKTLDNGYEIFAIDNNVTYTCFILTDLAKFSGDTAQEIANKVDFETNYKSSANAKIIELIKIKDSGGATINPAKEDGNLALITERIGEINASPTAYTVQDRLKSLTTLFTSSSQDTTGSGLLTAVNQAVTLTNFQSKASVGIDISGTFSAKLVCEGSIDGSNWLQLELYESKYLAPFSGSIKTTGQFHADITGFSAVRIRVSSYTSGTATVYMRASNATLDPETHGTLWQRYSSAGRGFTFTTNLITITGTAEVDFVLIKNPTGTEKTVRLYEFLLNIGLAGGAQSLKSTYRLYRNPTITVNGTTITVQKVNPLGSFNPIVEVYTLPTITARGTLIQTFPFTQGVLKRDTDLARYIIDGSNLLITAEPATTNTEHAVSSAWAEVEA